MYCGHGEIMLVHPTKGQRVQAWYNKRLASWFPLHGKIGVVEVIAKGKGPLNHGVLIDGKLYAIPCGNLRKAPELEQSSLFI